MVFSTTAGCHLRCYALVLFLNFLVKVSVLVPGLSSWGHLFGGAFEMVVIDNGGAPLMEDDEIMAGC